MACERACSPGGSCCSTSGGAGCPSDPSLPSPTAHSASGKSLRRCGPRRAASAAGWQLRSGLPWAVSARLRGAQWDDMADLQTAVADDDALDDELQDRLLVGKRRL